MNLDTNSPDLLSPSLCDFVHAYFGEHPDAAPGAIVTCTRRQLIAIVRLIVWATDRKAKRESFEFMAVGCKGPLLGNELVEHFLGPEDLEEGPPEPPTAKVSRALWSKTLCAFHRHHGEPVDHPKMARSGRKPGAKGPSQ